MKTVYGDLILTQDTTINESVLVKGEIFCRAPKTTPPPTNPSGQSGASGPSRRNILTDSKRQSLLWKSQGKEPQCSICHICKT